MTRICEFTETWVITQWDIKGHIKSHFKSKGNNMIASFSFAARAYVTRWSNYLTQWAEILAWRSNLTLQRAKITVNDMSVVSEVPKSLALSYFSWQNQAKWMTSAANTKLWRKQSMGLKERWFSFCSGILICPKSSLSHSLKETPLKHGSTAFLWFQVHQNW